MKDVYNMTSKFFNGIISDMKGVSEKDIGIVDQYGKVIACTDETKKDNMLTESLAFFKNKEESGSTKDTIWWKATAEMSTTPYLWPAQTSRPRSFAVPLRWL